VAAAHRESSSDLAHVDVVLRVQRETVRRGETSGRRHFQRAQLLPSLDDGILDLKPTRFLYQAICLLTRYLAREDMGKFVTEWGTKLYGRHGQLREEIRKILNSPKSRIRAEIAGNFMTLEHGDSETINAAFEKCQKNLKLRENIDPFAAFAELDENTSILDDHEVT
jgi:hypothetical protein